ncbi:MAG: hypothetical protein WC455_19160 [Dehalococcoidia bacterium]|jgi:hypothetical protein
MQPHSIKFNGKDWQTLQALAQQLGFKSAGNMVSFICQAFAIQNGKQWSGGASWGSEPGSNRGRWKKQERDERDAP